MDYKVCDIILKHFDGPGGLIERNYLFQKLWNEDKISNHIATIQIYLLIVDGYLSEIQGATGLLITEKGRLAIKSGIENYIIDWNRKALLQEKANQLSIKSYKLNKTAIIITIIIMIASIVVSIILFYKGRPVA